MLFLGLATELLLDRYELPQPANPNSILARHEAGLFGEHRSLLAAAPHHRSQEVNKFILPHCQSLVESIGHRMAYEAAVAAGVMPSLIDLYVASVVKLDPAWYSENASLNRQAQTEMEDAALDAVLPHLGSLVGKLDILPYVSAPIISDVAWTNFVGGLEQLEGTGETSSWWDERTSVKHHL